MNKNPFKKVLPKLKHNPLEEKIQEPQSISKTKHVLDGTTSIYKCLAHPDKYLQLQTNNKNTVYCKSCGSKIFGQTGYLACTNSGCFYLCSSCRICHQNHFLSKVFSFKQSEGTNHADNKFQCRICQEEQQIDPRKGIFYCTPCDYSICPSCTDYEKELWTKK